MQHKLQLSSWSRGVLAALRLASLHVVGCSNSPPRVGVADWEPEAVADRAISSLDKDGNGQLSMAELVAASGLKYCAKQLDTSGDGQLNANEISDRIREFEEMCVGLVAFSCQVALDGRPLTGAKVRLLPEPFLGAGLKTIESTSQQGEQVSFAAERIQYIGRACWHVPSRSDFSQWSRYPLGTIP